MAFLDNSGDIILDVVLTDEGRRRLAKGDGSFRIVKFALGDDEVNYNLFDNAAVTSLQDLQIMQTPVFEAFTNNTSTMKSKLLTIPRTNLLYLPIMRLNEVAGGTEMHASGTFMVAVDENTEDNTGSGLETSVAYVSNTIVPGFLLGASIDKGGAVVRVDAGIDNNGAFSQLTDGDLIETDFEILIDNRLGSIVDKNGKVALSPIAIDDDNIATYQLSAADTAFVFKPTDTNSNSSITPIKGPIGSFLEFKIKSTLNLKTSYFLFDKLGNSQTMLNNGGTNSTVKIIDSTIRVSGRSTGYNIDIPVRYVKLS